jgi:hypothetical protein
MAKVASPTDLYGYKWAGLMTLPLAATQVTIALTPEDSDLHDITKEGILITRIETYGRTFTLGSVAHFGIFNKTTLNDPIVNYDKAVLKFHQQCMFLGAAYGEMIHTKEKDLTSMPGGGAALIADFLTFTGKLAAAVAADQIFEYRVFYRWININSDDYRSILYARSV